MVAAPDPALSASRGKPNTARGPKAPLTSASERGGAHPKTAAAMAGWAVEHPRGAGLQAVQLRAVQGSSTSACRPFRTACSAMIGRICGSTPRVKAARGRARRLSRRNNRCQRPTPTTGARLSAWEPATRKSCSIPTAPLGSPRSLQSQRYLGSDPLPGKTHPLAGPFTAQRWLRQQLWARSPRHPYNNIGAANRRVGSGRRDDGIVNNQSKSNFSHISSSVVIHDPL